MTPYGTSTSQYQTHLVYRKGYSGLTKVVKISFNCPGKTHKIWIRNCSFSNGTHISSIMDASMVSYLFLVMKFMEI